MMKQQQLANILAAKELIRSLPTPVQKMLIERVTNTTSYNPQTRLENCFTEVAADVNKLPHIWKDN
jgi:hypothetical protein